MCRIIFILSCIMLLFTPCYNAMAECRVTGDITATVVKDKWFGLGGEILTYRLHRYIDKNGRSVQIPNYFQNVDKYYQLKDGRYGCEVNSRGIEFIGTDNKGDAIVILPEIIQFNCICY